MMFIEVTDDLGRAFFGDGEVGRLETGDGMTLRVGDDDVEENFTGCDGEGGYSGWVGRVLRGWLCRWWVGRGLLGGQ